VSLVDDAIAAHGGAEVFARGRPIHLDVCLRGNILASRLRSPLVRRYRLEVDTRAPRARLAPFHRPGRMGVFDGDRVAIEDDGRVACSRVDARAHACAHVRWDALDLLYFVGYALWNYVLTPYYFAWPGMTTREIEPWRGLRRLEVVYPPGFPTHAPTQIFYFDAAARQVRLDYTAEVFGRWAHGAHLLLDHRVLGGLLVATHRRVHLIGPGGRPLTALPAAMEGWVDAVEIG
jgi:hypothetical protein